MMLFPKRSLLRHDNKRGLIYPIAFFLSFVFGFLQLATVEAQGQEAVFNAQMRVLDNGLRIVVVENHRAPVVAQMIWYGVGAKDEASGETGLAHYLEHLMFKGTHSQPPGAFSKLVKRYGGSDNAFTSWDYTAYFQQIPVTNLDEVMAMEADRMRNLNPPQKHAISERAVVVQERNQVLERDPAARLRERMRAALFANHPYGRPIIGWMPEIEKLNWQKAEPFYKQYYRPDNAVLILSGAVTMDQVYEMASRHFGPVTVQGAAVERRTTRIAQSDVRPHFDLFHASVRQALFLMMGFAPSWGMDATDALALQIVDDWLAGVEGPLYQRFVVNEALASAISFSYNPYSLEQSNWSLGLWPIAGQNTASLKSALGDFFANLSITEEELSRVKNRMMDAAIYQRDSLMGPAMTIGHVMAAGGTLRDVETWPERLEEVTVEQVNKAIQTHLSFDQMTVTGWLDGGGEE